MPRLKTPAVSQQPCHEKTCFMSLRIIKNEISEFAIGCLHRQLYIPQFKRGGLAQWLASRTTDQAVPGSRPGRGTVCCGLEQVTFTHCLVLVKPRKPWTDDSD